MCIILTFNSGICFVKLLSPNDALKYHHFVPKKTRNFITTDGFRIKNSTKLVYQCMVILFYFQTKSSHLYPLQVENSDRNSRFVVDKDENSKFRLEWVNKQII